MQAIQIISQDLFDKVRSRFQNLEMGDETGAVTIDPALARFFDFDFIQEGNNLGRVSISLNEPGSLKIYYSQGITENQDDPAKQFWFKFLKEMRFFSMRRLLRFDTRDITKTNLDKNDFQVMAATQSPKEEEMPGTVNESRWNSRNTKKTSRAVRGTTEVIVRHSQPVDEMFPGARSQKKNIKAIFIQNKDGERFKYPFIHPAGAFAMAQHVDHGGVPHDPAGKAIIKMSEQIAQLQEFQRKISRSTLHDDATGITEKAVGRLQHLKAQVEALGKRHHYEAWAEGYTEGPGDDIMELDAVTMEQYKQAFTQTSFEEELAGYFPLLHKIMSEENTVDLEDYVGEAEDEVDENGLQYYTGKKKYGADGMAKLAAAGRDGASEEELGRIKDRYKKADEAFEQWAEAVEQGKLTDDEIEALKKALAELPQGAEGPELDLGPDGSTAWEFFSSFGLDDPDLEKKLQAAAEVSPDSDPFDAFKTWANDNYPEILVALGVSGDAEAPPAEAPPAEAPPAEAPPADAAAAPAPEQPTAENEEHKGMEPVMSREGIVKEVAKIVKSFYNADNPNVGPFRGSENIALDCKKQIAEKFGDKAGAFAEQLAGKFIDKLTTEWHHKHGQVGDDGLARLKELLNNIKGKVESIGDVGGHPGKNIMPAEEKNPQHSHQYDTTMKHADNPTYQQRMAAHDIKPGIKGYRDRIDMLKDLERTGKLKSEEMNDAEKAAQKPNVPAYLRKEKGGDWKTSTQDLEKAKERNISGSQGLAALKSKLGMNEEFSDIIKLAGLAK